MNPEIGKVTKNRLLAGSRSVLTMMFTAAFFLMFQATCFATNVVLQWDPDTDPGVTGYKVYYQADSSTQPYQGSGATQGPAPINALNQTTATISGLDPNHAYYFAVTAYNASGVESSYSNIVSIPELAPPTTALSYPTNNTTVSGTVSVTASASDNVGVTKVEYYVNGVLKGTDTTTPYVYSWNTSSLASGSYTLMTKAYDAAGNVGQSSNVAVTVVNDTTAPVVSLIAPVNGATVSGTVAITANASDNVGVSKVEFYSNGVLLYASNVSPYSYNWNTTAVANGSYTLTAKAYDNVGNIGQSSNISVTVFNDTAAPTISAFTMPATASSTTVAISSFTATDNASVAGYLITQSATAPAASATGWTTSAPTTFTFSAAGSKTAYAWAKDAAGNISSSRTSSVTITLPDTTAPTVSAFTMPATATTLNVPVSSLTATDNVGISGYLITESSSKPTASVAGWTASAPVTFTFSAAGSKTTYAWAKDAAGNVSASRSAVVTITLPDTTAPVVSAFTMPTTATTLNVPVSSLTATDNVGISGYLITESATAPAANASGWTTSAPTSFTFSVAGSKTAYAWAKDATGNVSSSRSATVSITLPDTTAPVVCDFTMPTTATVLSVSVSSLTASDAVGVTGYLITESATAPAANASGWTASALTSFTFSVAGSKTAYAWAKDAAGNISASRSAAVTITLPDTTLSDTTLPTITFNTPTGGATVSSSVTVTATAADNIGVARVELYINGVLTRTDSVTPFSFTWNTTTLPNGNYTLKAVAYDTAGNSAASELTVTVKNSTSLRKKRTGDLNRDGKIDLSDALLALKMSVGLTAKTVNSQVAAAAADDGLDGDVAPLDASGAPHGDGVIDAADALLILKNAVGMVKW